METTLLTLVIVLSALSILLILVCLWLFVYAKITNEENQSMRKLISIWEKESTQIERLARALENIEVTKIISK